MKLKIGSTIYLFLTTLIVFGQSDEVNTYNTNLSKKSNTYSEYLFENEFDELEYEMLYIDLLWWKSFMQNNNFNFSTLENHLKIKLDGLKNNGDNNKLNELIYLSYS